MPDHLILGPCTIASKIIVTPKAVYFLISKLCSLLAVANIFACEKLVKFVNAVKFL